MSLINFITYIIVLLYLFLAWRGRSKRRQKLNELHESEQGGGPSVEELHAWRQSLGIATPHIGSKQHQQPPKTRNPQRTMPNNFRFQATLDKYRRATNIDTRDFSSRIEGRKAPVDQLVSSQLRDDAPMDAYRLDIVKNKSLGWQTLEQVGSKKNLVIIQTLLSKPKGYLAPSHWPGYWWENSSR